MSNASNQRTLFQSWGSSLSQNKVVQPKNDARKAAGRRKTPDNTGKVRAPLPPPNPLWTEIGQGSTSTSEGRFEPEDGDDDDLMLVAVYEAEKTLQVEKACQHDEPAGAENISMSPLSPPPSAGRTYPDLPGFDSSSAKVWIYPTNYPIRDYQLKMSEAALFQNTLVCLPTGLGKTFIASVVMYNFYRWYPAGKIVFMAPTKPLVAQQIEACYKVMGIPQAHMAELTGSTAARQRQEVWRSKRVFFLTPQVMVNDLSRDTCPALQVKCVVIDEAHKALGNHAYCQVIRQLGNQTLQFRVLALSATPGGDTKAVQSVISNLLISHVELRSEESPDIQAHSHQRSVVKMVVPLGDVLAAHQARYLQVLEKFMSRLVQNRVMMHKDLRTLSKYQIILARDQFRKNPPPYIKGPQQGLLEGDFAICISLYHGYELLMQMGLRSLFFYIQGIMDGSREMSRAKNELQRTPVFMDLYHEMEAMFVKPSAGPDEPFIYSHPKLEKLEEVVLHHFRLCGENAADTRGSGLQEVSTRVMIFSSFRESVQEIAAMLDRHAPLIRVMTFMGQASAGKGVKGFTQKEQLEVVHRFRQGGFNTLVSTCVGEEGLDIGEVDLIVCFDAQKNPIRLVQRMGRTGRKREGRIVVILSEGREERTYNQSQSNKRSVFRSIVGNKSGFHMYPNSPRMLPEGVNPALHKMHITCGQFDHRDSSRRSARGRRSHSGGRASLIHPQNLNIQESATSDGFLSSSEFSLWASSMKLQDDEAHPALKHISHFLTLPDNPPPQEDAVRSGPQSRQLSLWEWRHWQHKTFPTHVVDHSARCQHFIKVMELVNGMREEDEGECRYERELRPYLSAAVAAPAAKKKAPRTRSKTSSDHLRAPTYVDGDADEPEAPVGSAAPRDDVAARPLESVEDGRGAVDEEGAAVTETDDGREQRLEDAELEAMFYLPSWGSAPPSSSPEKLLPGTEERLRTILADVAELLSTSPPPLTAESDAIAADQTRPPSPGGAEGSSPRFQVSFTLDVDEDDEDVDGEREDGDRSGRGPLSPTWDEVFGEDDDDGAEGAGDERRGETERTDAGVEADQSMDLFGDDEAFLEMTIPEIPTPEDAVPPRTKATSPSADGSLDLFSVNFDLGYSLEDSEEEVEVVEGVEGVGDTTPCRSASLQPQKHVDPSWSSPVVPNSSTPQSGFHRPTLPRWLIDPEPSTPHSLSAQRRGERSPPTASPLPRHVGTLSSLLASPGPRGTMVQRPAELRTPPHSGSSLKRKRRGGSIAQGTSVTTSALQPAFFADTDSEDEVVPHKRRCQNKVRPLLSPETTRFSSDADSPVVVSKRRVTALPTSDETEAETLSDDDFQSEPGLRHTTGPGRVCPEKTKHVAGRKGRQFLDEEAELSEDGGAEVSSDEEDGDEQDRSLHGFVVDNTHVSQGLNDSEMQGVYLKSVRSPAVGGRFKMSYRNHQNMDVFSQVPEADEEYAEDSFVVGSEVDEPEEGEAEDEAVELMPEDSYVDGRRRYATRRRVLLHRARAPSAGAARGRKDAGKGKRGRVIRVTDSSEEETDQVRTERGEPGAPPPPRQEPSEPQHAQKASASSSIASKLSLLCGGSASGDQRRCRQRTETQHQLSDQLDFTESESLLSAKKPPQVSAAPPPLPLRSLGESPACSSSSSSSSSSSGSVRILADSRCLSAGVELLSSLRQRHAAAVHVCSLDGGYFIVSNRMAVERHSQSDLSSVHNRQRLAGRVRGLQTLFERVCLIVETDRTKPGETPRPFQRTRCYDSTLAALVQTGVRLLWSNGAEESARLLADLARLEQRKGQGLSAPVEVKGHHGQQALQLYRSLPSVNYAHALNMSCNFSSVSQLINSSIEAIQKGGCMSRARAEEIYRFLRFSCDPLLMKTPKAGKSS